MRIYLSAGELSGDHLGASLARALKRRLPEARLEGYGGAEMKAAGVETFFDLPALAVMGILPVIRHVPTLRRLLTETRAYLAEKRPDVVVLIDYPGWHFVVAKEAKKLGIPVVQFVAPQLWAWAPWRIRKVRERIDRLLVLLPFEEVYFRDRGVEARYVGHPLVDRLATVEAELPPPPGPEQPPLIGILPGSRKQEWTKLLPMFLRVGNRLRLQNPDLRFLVACADERFRTDMDVTVRAGGLGAAVRVGETHRIQRDAVLCLTSSGTATLECTYFRTPMVVAYPVKHPARLASKLLVTAPFIALTNLLAGRELVPEFLYSAEPSIEIADAALAILNDDAVRASMIEGLDQVRDSLVGSNPSDRAADEILALLESRTTG